MLYKQSLTALLSPWVTDKQTELPDVEVASLELDSRNVRVGDTFVAIIGHAVDGRKYIENAIENGANAVIAEACDNHPHASVHIVGTCPVIYVDDLSQNLSAIANRLYHTNTNLIAVTGTNGKTTITQLIAQWIDLLDKKSAVMGTTGNGFLDRLQISTNTTGSAVDISKTLATLADEGADYAALEVSSHGLVQGRVKDLCFRAGVFTNLSRDHLDYHKTMEEYAKAKLALFTQHQCEVAVINVDDPVGDSWLSILPDSVAVSIEKKPTYKNSIWATSVEYSEAGITLSFDGLWGCGSFTTPLIGAFNASNVLLSLATLLSLGFDKQRLLSVADSLKPVIGRMELFKAENKAKIVVDYAHTPDALEKALSALRVHCKGKLWAIFGCGGDRDSGKRPMMAEIAERLADKVILTDDNPRSEDPAIIFQDMLAGVTEPEKAFTEHDRYRALNLALTSATQDDIILLAGKGHEDYQVLANETIHYSDRESAQSLLGEEK